MIFCKVLIVHILILYQLMKMSEATIIKKKIENIFEKINDTIKMLGTTKKKIGCNTCGSTFAHSGGLSRHITEQHTNLRYLCKYCGRKFKRESSLITHEVKQHE